MQKVARCVSCSRPSRPGACCVSLMQRDPRPLAGSCSVDLRTCGQRAPTLETLQQHVLVNMWMPVWSQVCGPVTAPAENVAVFHRGGLGASVGWHPAGRGRMQRPQPKLSGGAERHGVKPWARIRCMWPRRTLVPPRRYSQQPRSPRGRTSHEGRAPFQPSCPSPSPCPSPWLCPVRSAPPHPGASCEPPSRCKCAAANSRHRPMCASRSGCCGTGRVDTRYWLSVSSKWTLCARLPSNNAAAQVHVDPRNTIRYALRGDSYPTLRRRYSRATSPHPRREAVGAMSSPSQRGCPPMRPRVDSSCVLMAPEADLSNPLYEEGRNSTGQYFDREMQEASISSQHERYPDCYPNCASARFEAMTDELSPPVRTLYSGGGRMGIGATAPHLSVCRRGLSRPEDLAASSARLVVSKRYRHDGHVG
jgi:hypothetical protein